MSKRQIAASGPRILYGVATKKRPRQDPRVVVENLTARELLLRGGRATGHGRMRESNF
jgi:hypothetical protein